MAGDNVPESRRLMINLMYLVLTALLALNVTREVLNAFNTMNVSIIRSNKSINNKNEQIYTALSQEMLTADSGKVRPWYEKALEIRKRTRSLMQLIDNWKDSLITASGGYQAGTDGDSVMRGMDNINVPYNIFVTHKHGAQLRDSMRSYIAYALNLIDSQAEKQDMLKQFPLQVKDLPKTEDNPSGNWSYGTFHNIPVIAGVALLSKYQNDIRNSEAMILDYFIGQIHAKDFKFNTLAAIAVPNTTYALAGQPITATIMLAAYNKDAKGMSISSSAGSVPIKDGVGLLKFNASGVGAKTVNGTIYIDKGSQRLSYPFKFDYTVGSAGASLQLDKMNVMYIGVDNPITVSASGYNIQDVSLDWSAGSGVTMKPGSGLGHYLADVTKMGTISYKIMAKSRATGGGNTPVGSGTIRVKRIPDPVAEVADVSSGVVRTGRAKVELGVVAALKNFDFEARFVVTSFQFMWVPQNGQPLATPNQGPLWNETVKQYIRRSRPGDRWIISDIKAIGPDHQTRSINSIVITLN